MTGTTTRAPGIYTEAEFKELMKMKRNDIKTILERGE